MRVYIAGPYTKGDVAQNVRKALLAADACHRAGHHPFVPHLSHFWHMLSPKPYETWLAEDFVWLTVCDAIVRLPGESPGADREVTFAQELGKPVYQGVEAFLFAQGRNLP